MLQRSLAVCARMHHNGVRVKMYMTTKELSSHASELGVLRELGSEVLTPRRDNDLSKGSSYLQDLSCALNKKYAQAVVQRRMWQGGCGGDGGGNAVGEGYD